MPSNVCPQCKVAKTDQEFGRRGTRRRSACKACERDAQREFKRRYLTEHGHRYEDRYKTERVCERCGASFQSRHTATRRCAACGNKDVPRPASRDRRLPVYVGPMSALHAKHPARRPAPKRTDWWQLIAGGVCPWCGEGFTRVATSFDHVPVYCSRACGKQAGKYARGRFLIAPARRLAIYERDAWLCQLCDLSVDRELPPSDRWAATLDHVEPRSKGGSDDASNLQLAHRMCNSIKRDQLEGIAA